MYYSLKYEKKSDLRGISLESSVQLGNHFYWISPNRQELHVKMAPSINSRQSNRTVWVSFLNEDTFLNVFEKCLFNNIRDGVSEGL